MNSYPSLQKKRGGCEKLNNVPKAKDQVDGRSDPALPATSCLLTWNYQVSACDNYKIPDLKYFILPQSTQPSALLLSPPYHPRLRSEYGLVCMKRLLKYDLNVKFLS